MKPRAPQPLLHAEGLAVLIGAILVYRHLHASWAMFALLFLAPDLFMIGDLFGAQAGARIYNLAHTYLAPATLFAFVWLAPCPKLLPFALIWAAPIGFDRLLGYGLKYEEAFKSTHLARV
jgi:hypothetical protein